MSNVSEQRISILDGRFKYLGSKTAAWIFGRSGESSARSPAAKKRSPAYFCLSLLALRVGLGRAVVPKVTQVHLQQSASYH